MAAPRCRRYSLAGARGEVAWAAGSGRLSRYWMRPSDGRAQRLPVGTFERLPGEAACLLLLDRGNEAAGQAHPFAVEHADAGPLRRRRRPALADIKYEGSQRPRGNRSGSRSAGEATHTAFFSTLSSLPLSIDESRQATVTGRASHRSAERAPHSRSGRPRVSIRSRPRAGRSSLTASYAAISP